ncbi:glutathione synthase/RimK-type ligase-like ATP-grasp enzyme [Kribbella aluminosa]|uniref:Glutathione synthase/RimK-type ligase-like ATP-grasp enzyme n=1 Tax=Kribbella aluminosa TaxID=416017 RepID=A0ABS4UKT8_9ACTN|nr:hypothetical protein [Kribbella aluminosa]MBP2352149.1 glutathione synthase/RimK-type ligase-like ATP-grasp enzyme [Kribbella aluminosa]
MTKRIALATSAELAGLHPDDRPLLDALRAHDLEPVVEVWTDPSVDWSAYDAVLLRTVWDYFQLYAEFTEWLAQLDKADVPVLNDTGLVRWNSDKQYLLELRERGVSIVPSQVAAGALLREVVAGLTGRQIVIKPTVSGNALHTVRGVAGSPELEQTLADLPDLVYLVQPFVPEIQSEGEWSLLFFDGEFSHAVVKRPADGDYRVQESYGGQTALTDPPAAVLEGARAALTASGPAPVYARVDGVVVNHRFLLMEIELIEPSLFFQQSPAAVHKLAAAVAGRL